MTFQKRVLRIISVILTVFLTLSVFLPAFAEEEENTLTPTCKRTLLVNIDTNMVLFSSRADEPFYCGFLPNIVTCMILIESEPDLTKTVTITKEIIDETAQLSAAKLRAESVPI